MEGHWRISATLFLIAFIGPPTAWAQEDEAQRPTRYEVEVIVFRHVDQSRNTPEVPPPPVVENPVIDPTAETDADLAEVAEPPPLVEPPIEADGRPLGPEEPGADIAPITEAPPRQPIDFYLLALREELPDFLPVEPERLELNSAYRQLEKLDIYEPLVHVAWTQQARSRAEANPYEMAHPDAQRAGVTGTVMLYKERFLHLKLDLILDPAPVPEPVALQGEFSITAEGGWVEPEPTTVVSYRLEASRRLRGDEAQYFDHPQFGVIASIREIEKAEEAAPEAS